MQIGQRIKKLRELRNFKQSHMAEKLGTTQQTYSRYENGEIELSVSKLTEIAKVLEVKPEEIFMFDDKAMLQNHYTTWTMAGNASGVTNHFNEELFKELKNQHKTQIENLKQEIERLHTLLKESLKK